MHVPSRRKTVVTWAVVGNMYNRKEVIKGSKGGKWFSVKYIGAKLDVIRPGDFEGQHSSNEAAARGLGARA